MDYTISKTKRNLIIFSAVFLMVKAIILVVVFQSVYPAKPDLVLSVTSWILQIAAYGYILIVLIGYFKHYELKVLMMITLGILALEIAGNVIQLFSGIAEKDALNHINLVITIGWSLALIIWIIFLFRIPEADFPALISIRKYAISVMAIILLSGIVPLFVNQFINIQKYLGVFVGVILLIPYVFIIEFGLKLPQKEQNLTTNLS